MLEKVQRRATKLIPCIRDKSYQDILKMLILFMLSKMKLEKGGGICLRLFKLIKGFNKTNYRRLFRVSSVSRMRERKWKLRKGEIHCRYQEVFFYKESGHGVE